MQEFYTVEELAELLRVKPVTIYRMHKRGELKGIRIGRVLRFPREEVDRIKNDLQDK